jgi:hypothetical protein
MSKLMGRALPFGLGALVVATVLAAGVTARADVTTDHPGSIIAFPKVIFDEGRDTVIQIANTGNRLLHAHCFYTNAQLANPDLPPSPFNPPLWQEVDFFIWLTRQQPTHWIVGRGRDVNPADNQVKNGLISNALDGAGIDPGFVPPVPPRFVGELVCVEVDSSGNPVSGNLLKGEATIYDTETGDVSTYAANTIIGHEAAGETGTDLLLDNNQYNSCPNVLLFDHFAHGVNDPVIEDFGACEPDCPITTELTLMPCQRDYENQIPGTVTIFFEIFNEFENRFSTVDSVTCWLNLPLDEIGSGIVFTPTVLGTLSAYTRIQPTGTSGGLLGVAEETHASSAGGSARAAFNLHIEGSRFDPAAGREIIDHIRLVELQ